MDFQKTFFDFYFLSELKMVHLKTKIWEVQKMCVFIMYFTVFIDNLTMVIIRSHNVVGDKAQV